MGSLLREYLSKYNILLHFNNSSPETLVILPPLTINKDEIKYFIKCTESILNKGFVKLFSKFIMQNIKDIQST